MFIEHAKKNIKRLPPKVAQITYLKPKDKSNSPEDGNELGNSTMSSSESELEPTAVTKQPVPLPKSNKNTKSTTSLKQSEIRKRLPRRSKEIDYGDVCNCCIML